MTRIKSLHQKITLTVILTLVFASSIGHSSLGRTETNRSTPNSHPSNKRGHLAGSHDKQLSLPDDAPSEDQKGAGSFAKLPPLPNDAPSGDQKGAGSFGPCQAGEELPSLTAIVPKWQDTATGKTYVRGETTSAYPTFWFYVPYQAGTHAEFVLQDKEQNQKYKTAFELLEIPGVISFTLPSTPEAELETNKNYYWYFKIKCDPQGSTDDFVMGWVSQIEPSPELDENNIWHDALTNRDTVTTDLLQRAGLSDLKPQPIVQQYTPSQ